MCKLGVISQERLKIDVELLLSANRKSCMPCQLAQQRMTLSDLEWHFTVRQYHLSGSGVHCDQMMHVSADLSSWLDSPVCWVP